MVHLKVSCYSDDFNEVINYENIIGYTVEIGVNIPVNRVLHLREIHPKLVKVFRSTRVAETYSLYSLLSWNIVEVVIYDPRYRSKSRHQFYIEDSEHVRYEILAEKTIR